MNGGTRENTKPILNKVVDTDNRANRVNNRSTTNTREVPYPSDDIIKGNAKKVEFLTV